MSERYAPPTGPPPSYRAPDRGEFVAPPPGPPPGHSHAHSNAETYTAPPGPPPDWAPSSGPPAQQSQPTPIHDWQTAVPDTSLLPPPPSLGNQRSQTNNATEREAEQGRIWCEQHPLTAPSRPSQVLLDAVQQGRIGIVRPRSYAGHLDQKAGGWYGRTKSSSWNCIISTMPLYAALAQSPLASGKPKTMYYEVRISPRNHSEISLALGFAAAPYPTFRLPGWHRGSLAVHGDDGSKFINDMWGGKPFTQPFRPGQTVGIGMTFTTKNVHAPPAYGSGQAATTSRAPIDVQVFFTRNGHVDGQWNLHEEGDAEEDLPVTGLEGWHDLYAAVGTFKDVEFEIVFDRSQWLYRV